MNSDLASKLFKAVQEDSAFPCCVHCEHFDAEAETCRNVGARPPARVIAFGCEQFEPKVPF